MSVEELYTIEIEGVRNTINSYAIDSFTKTYTNQLSKLTLPKDRQLIYLLTQKLLEWYNENYEKIMASNFVMNKADHTKAKELLTTFIEKLNVE